MKERTFLISLEPIHDQITTDGLLQKLRLMAAGCGLRIVSAERLDEPEQTKENEH